MSRDNGRGNTPPTGDALLSAILDGAHEARMLRDGTVVVAFALDPLTAEALFAFGSDEREDDDMDECPEGCTEDDDPGEDVD